MLGEYKLQDGSVIREYVWLRGMPVVVVDGSVSKPSIYYVQTDHLNAPRVVIDRAGVQRWSWLSEPFGNSAPVENPVGFGAFTLNLRIPGQYFDLESGLLYNGHRTYDAGVGRYTQSDPIGLKGGINTYAYVGGNPISYVDPDGLRGLSGGARTGPQPMPSLQIVPSGAANYSGRLDRYGNYGDGMASLTGAGEQFRHPSVPNAVEALINPQRTGPFVPTVVVAPGCVLISKPQPANMCTADSQPQVVCGPTVGPRP